MSFEGEGGMGGGFLYHSHNLFSLSTAQVLAVFPLLSIQRVYWTRTVRPVIFLA